MAPSNSKLETGAKAAVPDSRRKKCLGESKHHIFERSSACRTGSNLPRCDMRSGYFAPRRDRQHPPTLPWPASRRFGGRPLHVATREHFYATQTSMAGSVDVSTVEARRGLAVARRKAHGPSRLRPSDRTPRATHSSATHPRRRDPSRARTRRSDARSLPGRPGFLACVRPRTRRAASRLRRAAAAKAEPPPL